jgi:hypothetical protein
MCLHPEGTPEDIHRVFSVDDYSSGTFGRWWDEQTDAKAAVDAVWPEETS